MKITKDIQIANAITHAGTFHADDVFSTVLLNELMEITLCRVNEIPSNLDLHKKIVYDIGGGKFDHHMANARKRDNQIKYCSFGLLFEIYGKELFQKYQAPNIEECYQTFIKDYVMQIDAMDNGIIPPSPTDYQITPLSKVIELFNNTWLEEKESDEAFLEGVKIAQILLRRFIRLTIDKCLAKDKVEQGIENSQERILLLDVNLPFMEWVIQSKNPKAKELLFAIFPSKRGGYTIQAINKTIGNIENRLDFPKEWRGQTKEQLQHQTGIPTFQFCHANGFLCACQTVEDAIKIAKLAIQKQ